MKIKITKCDAFGHIFSNLTPGSEHVVIRDHKKTISGKPVDYITGYWVMGEGGECVVLTNECEIIEQ